MAYKNKKKNAKHQAEIRKVNKAKNKSKRKKEVPVMTENDYLRMMRQQGLI